MQLFHRIMVQANRHLSDSVTLKGTIICSSTELDYTMPLTSDIMTSLQTKQWPVSALGDITRDWNLRRPVLAYTKEKESEGGWNRLDWDVPWQTRNTLQENNREFLLEMEPLKWIQVRIKSKTNTVKKGVKISITLLLSHSSQILLRDNFKKRLPRAGKRECNGFCNLFFFFFYTPSCEVTDKFSHKLLN